MPDILNKGAPDVSFGIISVNRMIDSSTNETWNISNKTAVVSISWYQ